MKPFSLPVLSTTHVLVPQSFLSQCPTLCDPMHCRPPGTSVHGILQARILQWVAMPSSRGSSWPRDRILISCVSCIAGRFFTVWATRKNFSHQSLLSKRGRSHRLFHTCVNDRPRVFAFVIDVFVTVGDSQMWGHWVKSKSFFSLPRLGLNYFLSKCCIASCKYKTRYKLVL